MQPRNDYSHLFRSREGTPCLLSQLKPDQAMLNDICVAERRIKDYLRTCIPGLLKEHLDSNSKGPMPRFLRQGSLPNRLLIDPIRDSRHFKEADADLGMYVPLEYLKEAENRPSVAARQVLDATEVCLSTLCARHQWGLERKASCFRVYIRSDAHVDLTVYATPRQEFITMTEAKARAMRRRLEDELAKGDITWEDIPAGKSLLATNDGWQRSNARAINDRIRSAHALHGEQFREQVKFQKAHRDFCDCKPSVPSIGITLIVGEEIDTSLARADRLDLQVLHLLSKLADRVLQPLPAPGNHDLDLLADLDQDGQRQVIREKYQQAAKQLEIAIFQLDFESGIAKLRGLFGSRFPVANAENTECTSTPQRTAPAVAYTSREMRVKPKRPHGSIGSA